MTSYLQPAPSRIGGMIHLVRGCRVMLDVDLGALYGVPTKRLNEQVKRNRERFPTDFAFQLTAEEVKQLALERVRAKGRMRSQIATASKRNVRYAPWVFTEHGAVMLASVLKSPVAIEASIRVVRAFMYLREMLTANKELSAKFSELERRVGEHDTAIKALFDAIKRLLERPTTEEKRREIGFHIKEEARRYRTRNEA